MRFFLPVDQKNNIYKELNKKDISNPNLFCVNEVFHWENIFNASEENLEKIRNKVIFANKEGWNFNYIFDPTCLGNVEFIREYHNKILNHLKIIQEMGVNYITLSIPYIVEIVLKKFPNITPILSMKTDFDCIQRIQFYEKMGVREFILPADANRNFNLLEKLRKFRSNFHIVLNHTCIYGCPYERSHLNSLSHIHNENEQDKVENWFDKCQNFYNHPEELIKSRWIRPEDIDYYLELGFKDFHLEGNYNEIIWLNKIVQSYINKKFYGNLLELLDPVLAQKQKICIDNRKFPQDFLQKFGFINCRLTDCSLCSYCNQISKQVINIQSRENTINFNINRVKMRDVVCDLR